MRDINADVVVIGAGVIGCSVAYNLAKRGCRVTVVEKGDICSGSSGACDKAAVLQSKNPGPHLEMALRSVAMLERLPEELDADIEFSRDGGMIVIQKEDHLAVMEEFVRRQRAAGLRVEFLGTGEAVRRQPLLSPRIAAATWSDMDGEVNPIGLTLAFAAASRRVGVRYVLGSEVKGLLTEGGRISGAETQRERIRGEYVVNAAGAWAPHIARMAGLDVPIKPRRGQILVSERVPKVIHGDVLCASYLVVKLGSRMGESGAAQKGETPGERLGVGLSLGQTRSGNLLLGGCREFAGYDTRNTPEALREIARHAIGIVPGLARIDFVRAFAGLRPYTPDGMPVLGPVDEAPGLIMAAGHEGDGIALSAITGELIAETVVTGRPHESLGPFRYSRFAN